jgi:hypothetical protein
MKDAFPGSILYFSLAKNSLLAMPPGCSNENFQEVYYEVVLILDGRETLVVSNV